MRSVGTLFMLILAVLGTAAGGQQEPAPRAVEFRSADGTILTGTYFAAAKPGPGVVLYHQSNRTRESWTDVATQLAGAGINTLTVDARGHGGSVGKTENRKTWWPQDLDAVFDFLASQPNVQRQVIGLGGAGVIGVEDAVETARRHPAATRSLVLMSGETGQEGLRFLHTSSQLPGLYVLSDLDEYPPTQEAMELLYVTASNPGKKLIHYPAPEEAPWLWYEPFDIGKVPATGNHGTDLFRTHPELVTTILRWFVTTLITTPGHAPADPIAAADVLNRLQDPGGAVEAMEQLTQARRTDPQAQLFPEISATTIGENFMRAGDMKNAVLVMNAVVLAYPDSADAHENLAEAYMGDGQTDLARQHAERALAILDTPGAPASSWTSTEPYRGEIRKGAQRVLGQLGRAPMSHVPGAAFRDCAECPEMVVIPAGNFTMGSSDAEKAWAAAHGGSPRAVADEAPQHEVKVPSFALGKYDVTRGEYAAFVRASGHSSGDGCGTGIGNWDKDPKLSWEHPGFAQTDRDPVVCVSWNDARDYAAWLSHKTGHSYRLPTEAEWEYAARAGTTSRFWWGDDDAAATRNAWFRDNSEQARPGQKPARSTGLYDIVGSTHPVGLKPANAFGLYDMAGNVWQWTEDCYDNGYAGVPADGRANETRSNDTTANDSRGNCLRVDRGGSWKFPAWLLRPATRERNPADFRDVIMGFRVARSLR